MQFSKEPPPRKKRKYPNLITDDPAFIRMVKALRAGSLETGALIFGPEDIKKSKMRFPWRVAADHLRRMIWAEGLDYRITKYSTEGGWAVRVVRGKANNYYRTEEGEQHAKSA